MHHIHVEESDQNILLARVRVQHASLGYSLNPPLGESSHAEPGRR